MGRGHRMSAVATGIVDAALADLDLVTPYRGGNSFSRVLAEWHAFRERVEEIDHALQDPLAPGAAAKLLTARALIDDVQRIAICVPHTGAALARRRSRR